MMNTYPFSFPQDATRAVAATDVSAGVSWPGDAKFTALRVYNATSVPAFVRLSQSPQPATLQDMPIAPNAVEIIAGTFNNASVILPSGGSGDVYLTKGHGL